MSTQLDLQEQEQLDALKAFWKTYGNLITWLLILAWEPTRAGTAGSTGSVTRASRPGPCSMNWSEPLRQGTPTRLDVSLPT
jgi:hypothetical protein